MTDILYIGDYAYSSWSLRGWLLFHAFDLPVASRLVSFSSDTSVGEQMAELAPPARTVPTAVLADGAVLWDSLAIAEELAQRHPDAGHWPDDPRLRALARSLISEMHSGFSALRTQCPMNVRKAYVDVPIDEALRADLDRLETLWSYAHEMSGGPWLCGDYSAADAFYAPVVARIAGFSLPVSDMARAYVDRHLAHRPFRRWRAMGLVSGDTLPWYAQSYPAKNWPGPAPRLASAVDAGPSVNETCPFSGKTPAFFMELDGRIWGFCNAFCRDKTVADPDAWDSFVALEASLT